MNKAAMSDMLRGFMANDAVVVHSQRCLYENDEVMVEQSVMDFADGSREAVLGFNTLKDGKIIRTETGATLVDKVDLNRHKLGLYGLIFQTRT